MIALLKKLWQEESGQAVVEYALVVGLAAIAVITTVVAFREQLIALWEAVTSSVTTATQQVQAGGG
jgi:Flp pilus assembly pilin Flp